MKPRSSPQHLPQQGSLLPLDAPDPLALATAAALRGHDGHYSELHAELMRAGSRPKGLNPLWQRFFQANGATGWTDLAARAARMQARVREDGATYNVYGTQEEGAQSARVWPLELLPMMVSADEWATLERGVIQRARLLDAVMADIYGERRLLDKGLLPASLVFAHPQYLRAMHGCKPLGGVHLHVVAFELLRGGDGLWWVVGQRTQAPSGLGYLLENRLIVAEQFPEAFRDLSVQRLAAAFQASVQGLMRLSPAGERARVALLTPGPRNETYFEHAFLARYLGVTLVEGGDLTVRGDKLFLKTTLGLERVDVLMRRVDDEYLDPLELRPDSALGVPGLLQAMRAGNVVVGNAPGAGWLESPGLSAFWPGVSKALLDEELLLPAATSWWCGEEAAWAAHRENLTDFVVAPTFPASNATSSFKPQLAAALSPSARAELAVRIQNDPSAYTLQARLQPAETPVWRDGLLEPRPYVLRVFALSDGQGGYTVLPGGLTRVAQRHDGPTDPWLSMQSGSASVDTWVLTDGEVDPTSLLPPPLSAADLSAAHWTVTSRSAENLFWLGRYTERAENCVRLARVTLETLAGDRRGSSSPELLRALDALARRCGLVGESVPSAEKSLRLFERALVHALIDTREATSVAWNLRAVQSCAQSLRERLSAEQWALIQDTGEQFNQQLGALLAHSQAVPLSAVLGVLGRADTHLAAITGGQTDRMTRDDGWRLLSVGRQIERLDFLCNALVECFDQGLHQRDAGFATMLALFDSTITYRAQFQGRREVLALLRLLVHDTDNPRSLAWVARTMRDRFVKLSRIDQDWATEVAASLPQPDCWPLDAIGTPDADGRYTRLNELLGDASEQALTLSVQIGRQFFSHVGRVDRMVWQ